jgi:chromosome segregation ATPase
MTTPHHAPSSPARARAAAPRLALLLLLLAGGAFAQEEGGRREREALHRAQSALHQAQEQQAALARDKAALAAARDQLDEAVKRTQSQLASSRSEAARLNAGLAHADEELAAARRRDEEGRRQAQASIDDLGRQLEQAHRLADERAKANASLTAMLERATQSLAAAEAANGRMHALGLQMIDELRGRAGASGAPSADPVLGFGQVKLENEAETLRDRLDAARLAGIAAKPAAAGR